MAVSQTLLLIFANAMFQRGRETDAFFYMQAGGKGKVHIKDVMDRTAESDPEYIKVVKEVNSS
jgi:hypothetical protein